MLGMWERHETKRWPEQGQDSIARAAAIGMSGGRAAL